MRLKGVLVWRLHYFFQSDNFNPVIRRHGYKVADKWLIKLNSLFYFLVSVTSMLPQLIVDV